MGPQRTKTIKNKFAAPKAGRKVQNDAVVKRRETKGAPSKGLHASAVSTLLNKKKKKKTYTAEELGIPKLNSITPVGVTKPKGKKKGKVFVDDPESMRTILAIVQAEKEGQIESKMIKARQMEEIREARRLEAEKKEEEKNAKLEEVKDSMRKKRKRKHQLGGAEDKENTKEFSSGGTKAAKPKKKKRVAFA